MNNDLSLYVLWTILNASAIAIGYLIYKSHKENKKKLLEKEKELENLQKEYFKRYQQNRQDLASLNPSRVMAEVAAKNTPPSRKPVESSTTRSNTWHHVEDNSDYLTQAILLQAMTSDSDIVRGNITYNNDSSATLTTVDSDYSSSKSSSSSSYSSSSYESSSSSSSYDSGSSSSDSGGSWD
jgi:uncharacterized membrane protein YgcG